ncbi:MAG: sigma 54-interacting transcriptional regulator [Burkholderiales bacterium]|nr:sigma 54-interacting transcriptional regulator [Burkholderiales bacterium]
MTTHADILVVDDDPDLLRLLTIRLEGAGYRVGAAASGERALAQVAVDRPALVITDLRMGGMDGLALFDALRTTYPTLPVIILTAHGTIPDAVDATRRGVFGYLTKPVDAQNLLGEVKRALTLGASGDTPSVHEPSSLDGMVTRSSRMQELIAKARLIAPTEASVLILGQSGSGKESLARAIHAASPRAARRFIAINCTAIPAELLESELFGHTRGPVGAESRDHPGPFAAAAGGTILLDEIGDMPLALQAKLLRVLQESHVHPAGVTGARLISASNRDIEAAVADGSFRDDLYYRLNAVTLRLPALAERRDDIAPLAMHFLHELATRYDRQVNGFSPEAMALLVAADWPGNVRQLRNVVEQAVALATSPVLPENAVRDAIKQQSRQFTSLQEARRHFEHDYLVQLLKITSGNVTRAARLARRNRTEFYKLLQRHKLEPSAFKASAR